MKAFDAHQKGAALSGNKLAAAFSVMTPAQIANISATRGLSEAQLRALLILDKYSDEKIEEIVLLYQSIVAKGADKVATDALTFSVSNLTKVLWANIVALGKWLVFSPAGPFVAATVAIVGAIAAYKKWGDTAERAAEQFQEAQSAYSETADGLTSIQTELDGVKSRLEELNNLAENGRLTPDQEAERKDIEATIATLKRQEEIERRLLAMRASEQESAALHSYEKQQYGFDQQVMSYEGVMITQTTHYSGIEYLERLRNEMSAIRAEQAKVDAAYNSGSMTLSQYKARMTELDAAYRSYQESGDTVASDLNNIQSAIVSTSGAAYEQKIALLDAIDGWLLFDATAQEALNHIRDSASDDTLLAADKIAAMHHALQNGDGDAFTYQKAIRAFEEEFGDYIQTAIEAGVITGNTQAEIQKLIDVLAQVPNYGGIDLFSEDLPAHLTTLNKVEENINSLSETLGEFYENGIVMPGTFSELTEQFGDFDSFENFVAVLGNSKSTMSQAKAAANALAEEYLNQDEILWNMTEATAQSTIAQLKKLGVSNAEEVVEQRLAAAKLETALATNEEASTVWESAQKLLLEAGYAEDDINALRALRVEKLRSEVASTNFLSATSTEIAALIDLASAAGVAVAGLKAVNEMKLADARGEYYGMTFSERTEMLNTIVANLKSDIADFNSDIDLEIGVKIPDGAVKSAADSAADQAKDAFEAVYNEMKHSLDMQEITIEEFYAWLDSEDGYRKYFKGTKDDIEDFRKYQKEVFDGMKEVQKGYIDDLDHEIGLLDDEEENEAAIIALYQQKIALLVELKDKHEAYLRSVGATDDEIRRNDEMQEYIQLINEASSSVMELETKVYEKRRDNINALIELTEDMIKQQKEDEKEALEDQKDSYKEIIDLQKKMLELTREEDEYRDSIAEKTKRLAEIEAQLAALKLDDSREARLEEGALLEEQADLSKELSDLQAEHFVDTTENALDTELENFEKQQDEKIDIIDDFLDDNLAIHEAAIVELDNMNAELYQKLESYAMRYTETTRDELLEMWNDAAAAAEKYGSITNAAKVNEDGDVDNEVQKVIARMRSNGSKYAAASPEERQKLADDSLAQGKKLSQLLGVDVDRDANGVWWIGGIGSKKLFDIYHDGTPSVGGMPTPKQNEIFSLLEHREMVLTQKHQDNLWNALKNLSPVQALKDMLFSATSGGLQLAGAGGPNITVEAPLHMYGNLNDETMKALKEHPREIAAIVSKELRKL